MDEVGRGAWPVRSPSAPLSCRRMRRVNGVHDSKLLTEAKTRASVRPGGGVVPGVGRRNGHPGGVRRPRYDGRPATGRPTHAMEGLGVAPSRVLLDPRERLLAVRAGDVERLDGGHAIESSSSG